MRGRYLQVVRVDSVEDFGRNVAYFGSYDLAVWFCRRYIEDKRYAPSKVAAGFPVLKIFDCDEKNSVLRTSVYPNAYDGSIVECLEVF